MAVTHGAAHGIIASFLGTAGCEHCGLAIRSTILFELVAAEAGGGMRSVEVWTHLDGGHERCPGRDTFAEPAGQVSTVA